MRILSLFLVLSSLSVTMSACSYHQAKMDTNDETRLQALLQEKRPVVLQCYEEFLKDRPDFASGSVSVRVDRNPDGTLYDARLVSAFPGSQPLVDCLSAEIKEWKLDPYYNRGSITLTWDFTQHTP